MHKINPFVDYNKWFKRFGYSMNLMNKPIIIQQKFLKLLSQRIRKLLKKTLGTNVINSPISFPCNKLQK